MSPEEQSIEPVGGPAEPQPTEVRSREIDPAIREEVERKVAAENNFLDVLMQEVEAQSSVDPSIPVTTEEHATPVRQVEAEPTASASSDTAHHDQIGGIMPDKTHPEDPLNEVVWEEKVESPQVAGPAASAVSGTTESQPNPDTQSISILQSQPSATTEASTKIPDNVVVQETAAESGEMGGAEPPAAQTSVEQPPPTLQTPAEREWETDSSPYESSDTSSSDDSSDEDSDDDMLDPEEAVRILMQDDGGSDDEGKSNNNGRAGLRTAHEQVEEVIPKPNITITEETPIVELGNVQFIVENTVLVKGKVTGAYQVLESGSALCLKDRTIVGAVAETIGRVEEPMYTVRFTNEEAIAEAGMSEKGTTVYYVVPHSTFVFTQPLQGLKGSDASNFHDEEVGAEEMEFSDDEKEAEHKRQVKLRKQGRADDGGRGGMRGGMRGRGRGRGGGGDGGGQQGPSRLPPLPETNGNVTTLDYDDSGEGYTPLTRPSNLHEMMNSAEPGEVSEQPYMPQQSPRGGYQNSRGNRGRSRSGFNDRGRGRGGNQNRAPDRFMKYQQNYQQQPPQYIPAPQQQPSIPFGFSFPGQAPPSAPQITPQASMPSSYSMPFSPSPISPLPNGAFNFQSPQFQAFAAAAAQQAQQGMALPPPPPPPQSFSGAPSAAPGVFNFGAQMVQQQQQQQQQQQHNQAAFAQVQRQLAEMNRFAAQNQGYGQGQGQGR